MSNTVSSKSRLCLKRKNLSQSSNIDSSSNSTLSCSHSNNSIKDPLPTTSEDNKVSIINIDSNYIKEDNAEIICSTCQINMSKWNKERVNLHSQACSEPVKVHIHQPKRSLQKCHQKDVNISKSDFIQSRSKLKKSKKEPQLKHIINKAIDEDLQTALALSRSLKDEEKRRLVDEKRDKVDPLPLNLTIGPAKRQEILSVRLAEHILVEKPPNRFQPSVLLKCNPDKRRGWWSLCRLDSSVIDDANPNPFYVTSLNPPVCPTSIRQGDKVIGLSQVPGREPLPVREFREKVVKDVSLNREEIKRIKDPSSAPLPSPDTHPLKSFRLMLNNPTVSDLQFKLDTGEVIWGHRFVFAAHGSSLKFEETVNLHGYSMSVVLSVLDFLYSGQVPVLGIQDCLRLANHWGLASLSEILLRISESSLSDSNIPVQSSPQRDTPDNERPFCSISPSAAVNPVSEDPDIILIDGSSSSSSSDLICTQVECNPAKSPSGNPYSPNDTSLPSSQPFEVPILSPRPSISSRKRSLCVLNYSPPIEDGNCSDSDMFDTSPVHYPSSPKRPCSSQTPSRSSQTPIIHPSSPLCPSSYHHLSTSSQTPVDNPSFLLCPSSSQNASKSTKVCIVHPSDDIQSVDYIDLVKNNDDKPGPIISESTFKSPPSVPHKAVLPLSVQTRPIESHTSWANDSLMYDDIAWMDNVANSTVLDGHYHKPLPRYSSSSGVLQYSPIIQSPRDQSLGGSRRLERTTSASNLQALDLTDDISIASTHSPIGVLATPPKRKVSIPQSFLTPMPKYDSMVTPELKKALSKFGVRPLPKKKALTILKEIYRYTHKNVLEAEEGNVPSVGPEGALSESQEGCPSGSQSSTMSSEDEGRGEVLFEAGGPVEESILVSDEEEDAGVTQSQSKAGGSKTDFKEALHMFIKSDKNLYRNILAYEPLELAAFHASIKDAGIKIGLKKLMDYLDEQCITFTMRNKEKPAKSTIRRKPKAKRQ